MGTRSSVLGSHSALESFCSRVLLLMLDLTRPVFSVALSCEVLPPFSGEPKDYFVPLGEFFCDCLHCVGRDVSLLQYPLIVLYFIHV